MLFESRASWIKTQAWQPPDRDVQLGWKHNSWLTTRFWVQLLYKRYFWVYSGLKQMSNWLQTNEPWYLTRISGREFKLENSLSENVQRGPLWQFSCNRMNSKTWTITFSLPPFQPLWYSQLTQFESRLGSSDVLNENVSWFSYVQASQSLLYIQHSYLPTGVGRKIKSCPCLIKNLHVTYGGVEV